MSTPAVGTDIPPVGKTRLITSANDLMRFTSNVEGDARSAITRGLAEYLEQLQSDLVGGRQVRFKRVEDQYSEPEKQARYPSAAITTTAAGIYDSSAFTPAIDPKCRLPFPDGRYLVTPAEYVQEISVEIWANDPNERVLRALSFWGVFGSAMEDLSTGAGRSCTHGAEESLSIK